MASTDFEMARAYNGFMNLSHFAERFWTYSVWSLEFLFVIPRILVIFLFATVSVALAVWKQRPFDNPTMETLALVGVNSVIVFSRRDLYRCPVPS